MGHNILTTEYIKFCNEISKLELNRVPTYLRANNVYVHVHDGINSHIHVWFVGVPQGSNLGHLLFLLFVSD